MPPTAAIDHLDPPTLLTWLHWSWTPTMDTMPLKANLSRMDALELILNREQLIIYFI
jgi:hypothetical protein